MKELINAFGLLSINQLVSVIFGFIRTKVTSILVGTLGVGVLSQAVSLTQLLQQVASLGLGEGLAKLIAEYYGNNELSRINKIILTAVSIFTILGLLIVLICWQFSERIAIWIFDESNYSNFVVIIGISAFVMVQYKLTLSIFKGLLQWRDLVFVTVVGYTINIISTSLLIYWNGILGAILSILAAQLMNLTISVIVLRNKVVPEHKLTFKNQRPDNESVRNLLRFVGPLATITIVSILSSIFIRSEIIRQLGIETNGIYQVTVAISTSYMGLFLNTLLTFGPPKVTTLLKDPQAIARVQNNELKLGVFILSPLVLILMTFREFWIPLLFSSSFLVAGSILIWQFCGDIFRIMRITMNITILPMERFQFMYLHGIFYWVGWASLTKFLLPHLGISAVTFTY